MEIFTVFSRPALYLPITKSDLGEVTRFSERNWRLARIREWVVDFLCSGLREMSDCLSHVLALCQPEDCQVGHRPVLPYISATLHFCHFVRRACMRLVYVVNSAAIVIGVQ